MTKNRWFVLFLLGCALTFVAVAIVRLDEVATDDSNRSYEYAAAIVMVAITLGPALMAEHLIRSRAPGVKAQKDRKLTSRRIRRHERETKSASKYAERLGQEQATWDHNAGKLRALYMAEFRRARARTGARSGEAPAV